MRKKMGKNTNEKQQIRNNKYETQTQTQTLNLKHESRITKYEIRNTNH